MNRANFTGDTIVIKGLSKAYGLVKAVDDLSLTVKKGEIYGFLGRNGAGKTTTIRMMLGLVQPDSGTIQIEGQDIHGRGKQQAPGALVEAATAYPNLTVRENLDIFRRLYEVPRHNVDAAIEALRLVQYQNVRAGRLSLGNLQRLALARAVLHQPSILILDEPANALDPAGIVEVREYLRTIAREHGTTIFVSSHILGEIEQLADRIGIIHNGSLISELNRGEWESELVPAIEIDVSKQTAALKLLQASGCSAQAIADCTVEVKNHQHPEELVRILVNAGHDIYRVQVMIEDLEARFMRLTGGKS